MMEMSNLEGTSGDNLDEPSLEGLASNEVIQDPVKWGLENIQRGRFYLFFEKPISMFTCSHGEEVFKTPKQNFPQNNFYLLPILPICVLVRRVHLDPL